MQVDFARGRLIGTLTSGVFCDCASVPTIGKMTFTADIAAGTSKATGRFDSAIYGNVLDSSIGSARRDELLG